MLWVNYRRSDCDIISHLVDVVDRSAFCNRAQLYCSSNGTLNWQWRKWYSFLDALFTPIKGIRMLHHFHFTYAEPCIVYVREQNRYQKVPISILRPTTDIKKISADDLPPEILPARVMTTRKEYFFNSI